MGTSAVPNPGSWEALAKGCTCPVIDNHRGHGVPDGKGARLFWYTVGCPVHSPKAPTDVSTAGAKDTP